jgi:hypothetical protein
MVPRTLFRDMTTTPVVTSVGPLTPDVRDKVAAYRDEHDHPNYNSALQAMLEEVAE